MSTNVRKLVSDKRLDRLEAFSDGVLAIAITLLVLEIGVPEDAGDDLLQAVLDLWPSYLAYAISVVTIGVLWIVHSSITGLWAKADPVVLRLNLLFLGLVAFIPFPTGLVADFLNSSDAERTALTVYALVLLAANASLALVWRYSARKRRLLRDDVSDEQARAVTERVTPSIGVYVAAVVFALVYPPLAIALFILSAVWLAIPLRWFRAARRRSEREE